MIRPEPLATQRPLPDAELSCYHCGDVCDSHDIHIGEKVFCCNGCRTVYELLAANDLCTYYDIDRASPGRTPKDHVYARRFEFLDDESIARQMMDFTDGSLAVATFHIPGMHCSSCIWLLEKLPALNPAVLKAQVDFPRKEARITWRSADLSMREVVVLLASIGYEPLINLQSVSEKKRSAGNRRLYYRIGVAGFAFGNVMLFSFPEYLSGHGVVDESFRLFFGYLNILLSIPVLLYSSSEFYTSAWQGLKQKTLNIDVPIALGIIVLFMRSAFDILTGAGAGFLDSFTGLVFFMLIGRIFQRKSYDALSFERDFRSYFPLSVTVREDEHETTIPLTKLKVGDRIVVRNQELVPADAVMLRGEGNIDYSFVTGESELVAKRSGDMVYAGGRQAGQAIELEVVKEIQQSYLTRLWNNDIFTKPATGRLPALVNRISRSFTAIVLAIAFISAGIWWLTDSTTAVNVFTAVLIVACPCALALSSPFAFGTAQRIFGNTQFYIKNTDTVENLARVDTIVFDKTGTLTQTGQAGVTFEGRLSARQRDLVRSLARHSTHTLSRRIHAALDAPGVLPVEEFVEEAGRGIRGVVAGTEVLLGSRTWTGAAADTSIGSETSVHVTIDGEVLGRFTFAHHYRHGLDALVQRLKPTYRFIILSGDTDREEEALRAWFGEETEMRFHQSPEDKLDAVLAMQREGRHVLMVGDGLNDAGALKAADVGVSISEDINTFSPACDAILAAEQFHAFDRMLLFARSSVRVVLVSFTISFLYNIVGLGFAVAGLLTPLVAAILMPVSSVSVVAFTTIAERLVARRLRLG